MTIPEAASLLIFLAFMICAGGVTLNEAMKAGPHPYIHGRARWLEVGVLSFAVVVSYGAAIALALKIGFAQ